MRNDWDNVADKASRTNGLMTYSVARRSILVSVGNGWFDTACSHMEIGNKSHVVLQDKRQLNNLPSGLDGYLPLRQTGKARRGTGSIG